MTVKTWLLFATTEFLLSLTPGPAVLLAISQGMRYGARASIAGTLGILSGNAVYFALSAVGLGTILIASASLFQIIKWLGAAYLMLVGLRMLLAAARSYLVSAQSDETSRSTSAQPGRHHRSLELFSQGLVTQLSNPKALVFFSALLPQFITSGGDIVSQLLILGITSVVIEFPILAMYGWVAERGKRLVPRGRLAAVQDGVAGAFLIGAGVSLATIRRP